MDEDDSQSYHDALRELVLPLTNVLVGNQKSLTDFLLPDWDNERNPSARELAVVAGEAGAQHVLVTGIQLPNGFVDNALANAQGPITGEKFERFETGFIGAGDTLSAALAALMSVGAELHSAVSEALSFLTNRWMPAFAPAWAQCGARSLFWALPPAEGEEPEGGPEGEPDTAPPEPRAACTDASPFPSLLPPWPRTSSFRARAARHPGGVNSPVRAFRAVGGTPRFIARGEGAISTTPKGAVMGLHRLLGSHDPGTRSSLGCRSRTTGGAGRALLWRAN